ncbi:MAG: GNAT family acetyltransferase [Rhodovibrionaceae bacterium]
MTASRELRIQAYADAGFAELVALWEACGLTRWYNVPERDLALWQRTASAEVLVGYDGDRLAASVCVGHDGHRGWVYYLAVDPAARGLGYGRRMMQAAEEWLLAQDCVKIHAIVRRSNAKVKGFYESIGYTESPCDFMERWLIDRGEAPADAPPSDAADQENGKLAYTITYLEMTAPPQLEPVHPPVDLRLALLHAERPSVAFYRYLYNAIGRDWLWWERRLLGDAELAAIVQDPRVEIYVLYAGGVPAGYFEIDRRQKDSVDLAYFGLLPDFVGRGLGSYFLTIAIETAWSSNPQRVTVNTNSLDHPRALPLYQRMGFEPVGQKRMKIDDPRRDPAFNS